MISTLIDLIAGLGRQKSFDPGHLQGVWVGEATEDEIHTRGGVSRVFKTHVMFRNTFEDGNKVTVEFKFIYADGEKREMRPTGIWQLLGDQWTKDLMDGSDRISNGYTLLALSHNTLRYRSNSSQKEYIAFRSHHMEEKWKAMLA